GITPHGTDKITTSPNCTASRGLPTDAPAPSWSAPAWSFDGSRANESITSCPPLTAWAAQLPPIRPAPMTPIFISHPRRFDQHLGDLAPRVLLLAGDQPAVAHGKGLEQTTVDVVGPVLFEHVLDPPRHHLLSDEAVTELLLDVREAG